MSQQSTTQPTFRRALAILAAVALSCAACIHKAHAESRPASAVTSQSGPLWAHELAQRTPDPAVRFGRLPNGLRYALQHNETPKDGVSMRLRIGAGSLHERNDEQGLAHFLEHMAFRGSTKVPDGEVVRMLQRQGLAFGPDTNAFTSMDQTVYRFDFPRADASAVDTGLLLLREIAEHLQIDASLVDQEKGVLLSEARARDGVAARTQRAFVAAELAGTLVPRRDPIGQASVLQAATSDQLRRFYKAHYRPDNATLVIVGNVDVDDLERQIRDRFGEWRPSSAPAAHELGIPRPQQGAAEFVAEGAAGMVALSWLLPLDARSATVAVERDRLVDQLGVSALNLRLSDRFLRSGNAILGVMAMAHPQVLGVTGKAQLLIVSPPDQWSTALDTAVTELRQLQADGVKDADLQRIRPTVRSGLLAAVNQASTRPHAAIADALVMAVGANLVYTSAEQNQSMAQPMLDSIQADEITASVRRLFGGSPLLFRSAGSGPVGQDALVAALAQAMQRPLQARAAPVVSTLDSMDFGVPSAVRMRGTDKGTGITMVQFGNGTNLLVKPLAQERNKVSVRVLLGQGRSGLPDSLTHALWALDAMPLGGTTRRSLAELVQWVQAEGKQLTLQFHPDLQAFVLIGQTVSNDLAVQLQVLAEFARVPAFRPELGEKLKAAGPMALSQWQAQPAWVYGREVQRAFSGGDPRLAGRIGAEDVAATKPEDLPAALREPLASAADVLVVGDVNLDDAIAAVQATFGAGPMRPRLPRTAPTLTAPAKAGRQYQVTHTGRADQAVIGWHWAQPDHWADPALAATGRVAATLLKDRLNESVRAKLGLTYSPHASSRASLDLVGHGHFAAQIETPPDKFDAFRQVLHAQLDDLAARPVSADELTRAKAPMLERHRKAVDTIGHWMFWLQQMAQDPRTREAMMGEADGLAGVTAERLQAFFKDHIANRPPIEISAVAESQRPLNPARP